jgi:hypothetical protein
MIIFAAGIIFVTQLTLYFNLHKRIKKRMEHRNVLLWYFLFFFYIAALILTLQGKSRNRLTTIAILNTSLSLIQRHSGTAALVELGVSYLTTVNATITNNPPSEYDQRSQPSP